MNLKYLSDQTLLDETKDLVHKEQEILTNLLHHLREIERRRLFSTLKYSSLFEYAIKELKYSEDQAGRRISAMRLMREIPEIGEKIASGSLSLTNMTLAQTLFTKEKNAGRPLTKESKYEIMTRLENQSTRAAQKVVCEINPEMRRTKHRIDFELIEDLALREKLLRVKGY